MTSSDPILHAFDLLARRTPLAPLVATPERHAAVGDVESLARAAGRALEGLTPDSAVGLAAPNGPGLLASLLALRRAGLAAVLLDARTPEAEALRTVQSLGAAGILRCRTGWPRGPEDWTLTPAPSPTLQVPGIAVIKLTSGSTGAPRGIATPAEALVADDAALALTMGLRDDDRLLATIPLSHSYGLSSLAMPALMRGTLLILPEEERIFDPFDAAARTGATVFPTVPAVLDALLRLNEPPDWPASLRLVLTAGAPLSPATAARFRETFGLPVHVFYGASECGGICYDREGTAGERGTVGTPVEGVRIDLEPVEDEEGGVVTVRSPAVAAGYLPPDETRLGGGRFVNGDLAVWRNGELVLRGRADDQINIKGKKVDPKEVEAVVGQLPGVLEVAVLGLPLPERADQILRAVIACLPGSLTVEDVVAWCRPRLSPHKVPRSVVLVPELPRNTRGKLDRRELRALRGAGD
ncbi:MAG TPA: fatty acid--CoA ligase family protein [Thermoanaerobaculia bacterium]|jgi:long-chain acyl-CoA synthetase|nr:fatty acid--CoA ligase family protein [Thermoanaerobaculia bacterium]